MEPNHDERRRLAAVERYLRKLPDPDHTLDEIADRMLTLCRTTAVVICFFRKSDSVVAAWAGDSFGSNTKMVFCDIVLDRKECVEIEDTLHHPLFRLNPAVWTRPLIRSFISMPLVDGKGHIIGALSALNKAPKRFTESQREGIALLAADVMDHLELLE